MAKMGRPKLPESEKQNTVFQIRINTELKAKLEQLAEMEGMTAAEYIRELIEVKAERHLRS